MKGLIKPGSITPRFTRSNPLWVTAQNIKPGGFPACYLFVREFYEISNLKLVDDILKRIGLIESEVSGI